MTDQFFCSHPEFGGGGWGHPWPDEPHYPHVCCGTCCPHSPMDERIAAGRSAVTRWIFLWPGALERERDTITVILEPEDIPEIPTDPDVSRLVVLSDGEKARFASVVSVDGIEATFRFEDALARRLEADRIAQRDERLLKARRLVATRITPERVRSGSAPVHLDRADVRNAVRVHSARLEGIAADLGWPIHGWTIRRGSEGRDDALVLLLGPDPLDGSAGFSRQLTEGRMSDALGISTKILSGEMWTRRTLIDHDPIERWPGIGESGSGNE